MLENDPVPPEISFTVPSMIASNVSLGYPFYPNQYVPPISAPTYTIPLTIGVGTGYGEIFTEERIRQLIREELTAYFDEEKDALSVSAGVEDIIQEQHDHFDALQKAWLAPFPEQEESIDG